MYWVLRGNRSPNSSGLPKLKPDVRDFKDSEAGQRETHPSSDLPRAGLVFEMGNLLLSPGSLWQVGIGGTTREKDISFSICTHVCACLSMKEAQRQCPEKDVQLAIKQDQPGRGMAQKEKGPQGSVTWHSAHWIIFLGLNFPVCERAVGLVLWFVFEACIALISRPWNQCNGL